MRILYLKKCLFLALALACPFTVFSQVDQIREKLLKTDELLIAAHRAAHQNYPENSLQAIREAIDLGVDIVEIDLRVTTDGTVYLMHDQTIDRTTTGSGDIEKLSNIDLQKSTLLFEGKDSGIAIPTLEEALEVTRGKIMVDLDLKTDKIAEVMAVVSKMDMLDEVIFFDSEWDILQEIKAKMPSAYVMPRVYKAKQIKKAYKKLDPVIVHIDASFDNPQTKLEARKYGVRLWINSLGKLDEELQEYPDSPQRYRLIENGASVVQTDLPEAWLKVKTTSHMLDIEK